MTGHAAPETTPVELQRGLLFVGLSLLLHAALFAALLGVRPPVERRATPVSVEIVETRPVPPPPPAPETRPEPETPPAPAPLPARRPPRVAKAPPPPSPRDAPPPPPRAEDAPPPPNQPPSEKPGPVRIGVSMSSTSVGGTYAAPTGNTLYGKAPDRAGKPEGGPAPAERYLPPSQVTSLPEPVGCDIPKSEYPEEARRLGIEGEVKLRIVVDERGRVRDVTVLRDPGHGFGAVAQRSARAYCRFRPARKDGAPVATQIPYTIRFEL